MFSCIVFMFSCFGDNVFMFSRFGDNVFMFTWNELFAPHISGIWVSVIITSCPPRFKQNWLSVQTKSTFECFCYHVLDNPWYCVIWGREFGTGSGGWLPITTFGNCVRGLTGTADILLRKRTASIFDIYLSKNLFVNKGSINRKVLSFWRRLKVDHVGHPGFIGRRRLRIHVDDGGHRTMSCWTAQPLM